MTISRRLTSASVAMAAAILLAPPPAAAQDAAISAERAAVFARMLDAPSDRALMLQYARLSVRMRDYEAAVSTLERLIDLEPGNAEARVELAAAYYALGSYAVAEYHLTAAAASGALTPAQRQTVEAYRAASQERDAPSRFSGALSAGVVSVDGTTGFLGTAQLDWRIDMGDANATDWVTEAAFSTYALDAGTDANDTRRLRLRTGPELRLTGEAFGARIQPYLELEAVRYPDAPASDFDALRLGLAYQNPLSAQWSVFADGSIGWGELRATGAEIDLHEIDLGLIWRPARETLLRLTFSYEAEDTATRTEDTRGIRADMRHRFDGMAGRDWTAGGFAFADWRDITDAGVPSDETVRGAGLFVRAYVAEDLFVEARGSHVSRDGAARRDDTILSMRLGWEF
jgi:hypothetical protein